MALDNPVGRLSDLLHRYVEACETYSQHSISSVWSLVLDVSEAEVPMQLARVARLLADARDAVESTGRATHLDVFDDNYEQWARAVLRTTSSLNENCRVVTPGALKVIASLADTLSDSVANEGTVPTYEEGAALVEELRQVLVDVLADQEMDQRVKDLIHRRLSDIIWSIEHININGPAGVREVVERLVGAVVLLGDSVPLATKGRIQVVVVKIWKAVTAVVEMWKAVDSAQQLFNQIGR